MLWMQISLTDHWSLFSTFPSPAQHAQLWKFAKNADFINTRIYVKSTFNYTLIISTVYIRRISFCLFGTYGAYTHFQAEPQKKKYAKVTGRTNTRLIANPITYHNCAKSPPTRGDVWSSRSRRFWIIIMPKFTAIEFAAITKFNKPFVAIGF